MKANQILSKNLASVLLPLFFLFPYLAFLRFYSANISIQSSEFYWAIKNSFLQSSVAAVVCVGLGLVLARGLLSFAKKNQKILFKLILVPQILPSLFSILIAFSILNPFPMGHFGVIFIFIFINLGFSVYQLTIAIQNKMGQLALVSEIYGLKKITFFRKVLLPILWPDLKLNFFLVFLFCLSSLSIPLVAGGGKGTNLEVLIFEKIFIEQNWDSAWALMVLQTGFVFCISYFFLKSRSSVATDFKMHSFYKSKLASLGLIIYLSVFLGSYLLSLVTSIGAIDDISLFANDIMNATMNSIGLLFFIILVCFILLIIWILDYVQTLRHSIAINFISVSTVLVGFSFYIWLPQGAGFDLWKIPLAFNILFFPILFKIFFEKKITQMKSQIIAAKIFAIPKSKIIFKIILSQCRQVLFLSSSLLMIWSLSDFAISRALGTQIKTLGLLSENFLSSYRLDSAYLVSAYILVIWFGLSLLIHFIFKGIYGAD